MAGDERVYIVVKAVVRLSHPAPMDLVLRKRLSVNIYKKQSLTSKFVKTLIGSYNTIYESGLTYEVVSNIPKVGTGFSKLFWEGENGPWTHFGLDQGKRSIDPEETTAGVIGGTTSPD